MSREYSPNPPLIKVDKAGGGKAIINVAQISDAHTFYDDTGHEFGSTIKMTNGSTIQVTKSLDDLWDML